MFPLLRNKGPQGLEERQLQSLVLASQPQFIPSSKTKHGLSIFSCLKQVFTPNWEVEHNTQNKSTATTTHYSTQPSQCLLLVPTSNCQLANVYHMIHRHKLTSYVRPIRLHFILARVLAFQVGKKHT